ncbi:metal ABC transporter permease, partial [Rhodopirellula bahusiensis]
MIALADSTPFWMIEWNWALDGWIVAAGMLCAVASSLLGCFLVLRRMSLLGDAISHAVLPGLAAAFLISGSRSSGWMFLGAVIVGVLTALLSDWIHVRGEVDEGASMGVVFTTLFAAGLIMIVLAADRVDLDPGCVLYGAIESTPLDTWAIPIPILGETNVPRVVVVLSIVTLINAAFVIFFFKELKMATFD